MSSESEIVSAISYLRSHHASYALLHCNSTYPTPAPDVRLTYINRLKSLSQSIVGYSSHDGSCDIPLAAVAVGASIIEVHITESREQRGTDHSSSIVVGELPHFVASARYIKACLGNPSPRVPSQGEVANRIALGKSLAMKTDLDEGQTVRLSDLIMRSPQVGFTYKDISMIVGETLAKPIKGGQIIRKEHLRSLTLTKEEVNNHPKLIYESISAKGMIPCFPVRYHDSDALIARHGFPALEFHMSSRDLTLDPACYLKSDYLGIELYVHAVEQYEDGFILDLAAIDCDTRAESRRRIERLIHHVNELRQFFSPKSTIPIILNIGGFTARNFADTETRRRLLDNAIAELEKLGKDFPMITLLPQTMPPYPWHQGGISHHNLLTSCEYILEFVQRTGLRLCLDISHTYLACAHFNQDFYRVLHKIAPYVAHLHLSDSKGVNGEGLDVGLGEISFSHVVKALGLPRNSGPICVVPEIWNGHYNNGERFARSLSTLDRILSHAG